LLSTADDIDPNYNPTIYEDNFEPFSLQEEMTFRLSVKAGVKNITIVSPNPVTLPLADFCNFVNNLDDPKPDTNAQELETRRYRDMYLVENMSRALVCASFSVLIAVGVHFITRT